MKGGNVRDYLLEKYQQYLKPKDKTSNAAEEGAPCKELIKFGYEVASAMAFLHKRKVNDN